MQDITNDVLKLDNVVCGVKQVKRALKTKSVLKLYLATDADRRITQPLSENVEHSGVPVVWVPSMNMLGHMCGIDVGCSAAAICR